MPNIGNLFVISAPSGGGKTSLVKALLQTTPNLKVSVSHTTRAKRPAEIAGVNYYFVDEIAFRQMLADNKFLEYATIFNHLYGTSKKWVADTLAAGDDVILEIDWQGCHNIRALFPECISIFIIPPSPEVLAQRLTERAQDAPDIIQQRLADARDTFRHLNDYDYLVLNDDFSTAAADLSAIIRATRLARPRQLYDLAPLLERFTSGVTP